MPNIRGKCHHCNRDLVKCRTDASKGGYVASFEKWIFLSSQLCNTGQLNFKSTQTVTHTHTHSRANTQLGPLE